jgi:hypothetical protein
MDMVKEQDFEKRESRLRILRLWETVSGRPACIMTKSEFVFTNIINGSSKLICVIHWASKILERSQSNHETADVSVIIFLEYLLAIGNSQPEVLESVDLLSKIFACCIVLASKMHESNRRVLMQSFTFAPKEELLELEVAIVRTVDLSVLALSPSLLAREMVEAWTDFDSVDEEDLVRRALVWVRLMVRNCSTVVACPPSIALAAVLLAFIEIDPSSSYDAMVSVLHNLPSDLMDLVIPRTSSGGWITKETCSLHQLILYMMSRNPLLPDGKVEVLQTALMNHNTLSSVRQAKLNVNPMDFSATPPEEGCMELSAMRLSVGGGKNELMTSPTDIAAVAGMETEV